MPTSVDPKRFAEVAAAAMKVLADASTTLAGIKARRRLSTSSYDPVADLRERWPDWRMEARPLPDGCGEVIKYDTKVLVLDAGDFKGDWQLCLAHAIAHLDLHLDDRLGEFSEQQCDDAGFYAAVRLDRERDRDWI